MHATFLTNLELPLAIRKTTYLPFWDAKKMGFLIKVKNNHIFFVVDVLTNFSVYPDILLVMVVDTKIEKFLNHFVLISEDLLPH